MLKLQKTTTSFFLKRFSGPAITKFSKSNITTTKIMSNTHKDPNEICPFENIHIVGLAGSLREGSRTKKAVEIALKGSEHLRCKVTMLNLADFNLPFRDGMDHETKLKPVPENVVKFRQAIKGAHGILLGTPEYHNTFSGVIKNALDWLTFDETTSKCIGLVACSGGALGGITALGGLREIGRALHAWVIPQQCGIASSWKLFDKNGNLTDEDVKKRLYDVGLSLAKFAHLYNNKRAQEFISALECSVENPGAEGPSSTTIANEGENAAKKQKLN